MRNKEYKYNCEAVNDSISKLVHNTLPRRELEFVVRHISQCDECYENYKLVYTINEAFRYSRNEKELKRRSEKIWEKLKLYFGNNK